jgi:hypothetical protein
MPTTRSIRAIAAQLGRLVLLAAFVVPCHAQVAVSFVAHTPADEWDTRTYRAIWDEFGTRIVTAIETSTCLPFAETNVAALVADDVSHSGGPEHPMQVRATYARRVKQATLVHELGHRHLWQLVERLEGIDGHMTLYLILDRVWADVWGEEFAEASIAAELRWQASYDYAGAWRWARSLDREGRARLWNELLRRNGLPQRCASPDARNRLP